MSSLAERLKYLEGRIQSAIHRANRHREDVQLLAVSKNHSAHCIRQLYDLGVTDFGENQVQQALLKMDALKDCQITWHFIGHLQSNKAKKVAESFDWIHSVHCLSLAKKLNDARPETMNPLNVCIQINVDQSKDKKGLLIDDRDSIAHLIEAIDSMPQLKLRGLMAIPDRHDLKQTAFYFHQLHELYQGFREQGVSLDTLSMGMSADFECAILENATMIRVGTLLMGNRSNQ